MPRRPTGCPAAPGWRTCRCTTRRTRSSGTSRRCCSATTGRVRRAGPAGHARGRWPTSTGGSSAGEAARRQFGAAVRLAADADDLPLLFHCSAGKDRTGWLAVVLLTALGVEQAAIRADYLLTNERSAGLNEVILSAMRRRYPELREESVPTGAGGARESYLDAGYEEVARRYGSFDAYLRDGLGLRTRSSRRCGRNCWSDRAGGRGARIDARRSPGRIDAASATGPRGCRWPSPRSAAPGRVATSATPTAMSRSETRKSPPPTADPRARRRRRRPPSPPARRRTRRPARPARPR